MILSVEKNPENGLSFSVSVSIQKRWKLQGIALNVDYSLWNHFVFVVRDETDTCAYVNGIRDVCQNVPNIVSLRTSNAMLKIGTGFDMKQPPYHGFFLDDLAFWKKALTADDIQTLYQVRN